MKKYVLYFRVSTNKQSLGIDAQKTMVNNFLRTEDIILASFEEKESGEDNFRPELLKALEICKKEEAILLIAKLDRLSRNLTFISSLMDSGVEFICVDMPDANKLTIHIMGALAQQEREIIAERTSNALKEIKNKIIKEGSYISKKGNKITSLGSPTSNLTSKARNKAVEAIKEKADSNENNKRAKAVIKLLKEKGMTLQQIADELNIAGFKTSTGKEFKRTTVNRLL